jgi:hypothetical protein
MNFGQTFKFIRNLECCCYLKWKKWKLKTNFNVNRQLGRMLNAACLDRWAAGREDSD